MRDYQICTNCVMDTTDTNIQFDDNGMCDHCQNYYNSILPNWHDDEKGREELNRIVKKIKEEGKEKKHDCLIGLSGGLDSSYLTYIAVEKLGLRPLVLSVDTGWNLNIANENVHKLIEGLKLDLETITVDWEEMKDLQVAFLKSQVPYQDFPQDHAIFAGLYNFAIEKGFKYILTGANYSTECVRPPIEWAYFNDLTLMRDIHRQFGTIPLKEFPICGMFKYRIFYRYFKRMQRISLLNYLPYNKKDASSELKSRFGWEHYKNKHYENIFTRFYEGFWLVKKFGYDTRRYSFSSLILTGQMAREQALKELEHPPYSEETAMEDLDYIANKLEFPKEEIIKLMNGEKKTYQDYKNSSWLLKNAINAAKILGVEKRNFR